MTQYKKHRPVAPGEMIFVWAIESVLLALISLALNVNLKISSQYFRVFLGILIMAGSNLVGHVVIVSMAMPRFHHTLACTYLASLLALFVAKYTVSVDSIDDVVTLTMYIIIVFNAVALVFASTKDATPLFFHRFAYTLVPLALIFRINTGLASVIAPVLVFAANAFIFLDRRVVSGINMLVLLASVLMLMILRYDLVYVVILASFWLVSVFYVISDFVQASYQDTDQKEKAKSTTEFNPIIPMVVTQNDTVTNLNPDYSVPMTQMDPFAADKMKSNSPQTYPMQTTSNFQWPTFPTQSFSPQYQRLKQN